MDQMKIGKFISLKRKEKNITQSELAEMLNVTDRAISKWENGICLPDASNMPELCKILAITINDLFSGEVVDRKENEKILEKNLLEVVKLKEEKDKQLLFLEVVLIVLVLIIFLSCVLIASYVEMKDLYRVLLIGISFIIFMFVMTYCLRIEQTAGYYECGKCHHKYVPTFKSVILAMHICRTRYFKCPKCGKKSWNKKVISK